MAGAERLNGTFQRLKPGSGGVRGVCGLRVRTNRVFHGSWVAPVRKHPGSNLNYKLLRKRVLYQQQVLQRHGFYTDTHKGIRNNARTTNDEENLISGG